MPKTQPSIRSGSRRRSRVAPYPPRVESRSKKATASSPLESVGEDVFLNPSESGDSDAKMAASAKKVNPADSGKAFGSRELDGGDMQVDACDAVEIDRKFEKSETLIKINDLSSFFQLPREIRDQIYGCVADATNDGTQYVYLQDGNQIRLPTVPALLQVSRRMRSEYFPVYVAKTEFVLGLASEASLKVVDRWLDFIAPEATELNQMSLILRNPAWCRGALWPNADVDDHDEACYTGFVEYWVDFKKSIADGNLIQAVGDQLFYHNQTSQVVRNKLQLFQQMAEQLRVQRAAETLTVADVRSLIDALLGMHGRFLVQEAHINRQNFGPW
ncbi:uncharacterized protein BDZ99DRAFT_477621 [Mytilinidion resinicola]|uniref:Uncharacterized protein n=1 Tax=Mytilinidion resinicola TaxID=574789 RepID=A0A6A6YJY1_9PEZI|nr:uncharacterized protein BDZ99DRAFT_477621 [Mytilinidion resinicola]KAF2809176.1 hypothetical protein BDZ99DRAFT_477621 [Mytilinidion resinicola]